MKEQRRIWEKRKKQNKKRKQRQIERENRYDEMETREKKRESVMSSFDIIRVSYMLNFDAPVHGS